MSSMVQDLYDMGLTDSLGGMPNFLEDNDEKEENIDFAYEEEHHDENNYDEDIENEFNNLLAEQEKIKNNNCSKNAENENCIGDEEHHNLVCKFFSSYSAAESFCCMMREGYVIKVEYGYIWRSSLQSLEDFSYIPF
ncbi:hypothetical protein [Desulfovibrio piger]|jgi:hypothetical protein|uniref:hypothetical protein n=1 Tax=Desulfovibrio piger TaxID=901 RepID=UPI0026ED18F3|nr:hypothetical protein [Desulfovibrio piger]